MKLYKKGFTLAELLVSMAVMLIVLSMVYNILTSGLNIFSTGNKEVDLQDNSKAVFYELDKSLKNKRIDAVTSQESFISNIVDLPAGEVPLLIVIPSKYNSGTEEDNKPFIYISKLENGKKNLYKLILEEDTTITTTNYYYTEDRDTPKVKIESPFDLSSVRTRYFNNMVNITASGVKNVFNDGANVVRTVCDSNLIVKNCFRKGNSSDENYYVYAEDFFDSDIKWKIDLIKEIGTTAKSYTKGAYKLIKYNVDISFVVGEGYLVLKVNDTNGLNKFYETTIYYRN